MAKAKAKASRNGGAQKGQGKVTKKTTAKKTAVKKATKKVQIVGTPAYKAMLTKLVASNAKGGARCSASARIRRQLRQVRQWKDRSPFPGRVELAGLNGTTPAKKKAKKTRKAVKSTA